MVTCQECPGGGQRVKIVLSFGLVALALFSALCVVVGQRVAPRIEQSLGIDQPVERSFAPGGVSYDELRNAPLNSVPVNESAAREIKRQDVYCPPCDQVRSPGFTRFVNYAEPITQASSPAPQPATPRQQVTVTSRLGPISTRSRSSLEQTRRRRDCSTGSIGIRSCPTCARTSIFRPTPKTIRCIENGLVALYPPTNFQPSCLPIPVADMSTSREPRRSPRLRPACMQPSKNRRRFNSKLLNQLKTLALRWLKSLIRLVLTAIAHLAACLS